MRTSRSSLARRTRIGRATVITVGTVSALGLAAAVGIQGSASGQTSDDGDSAVQGSAPGTPRQHEDGESGRQPQFGAPQSQAPQQGSQKKAPHASSSGS